jgi:hypothetical protein
MVYLKKYNIFFIVCIILSACVTEFVPQISEDHDLMVVEGLITDQPGQNSVKLTTSLPLGVRTDARPLSGCNVSVSDDSGNSFVLKEKTAGNYVADPSFHGIIGRFYTLHINGGPNRHNQTYVSLPALLSPVPAIDSVYYEKEVLSYYTGTPSEEGCNIYLDTYDRENVCKYYRWEYVETWSFSLPYYTPEFVPNSHCWITKSSENINVKNTTSFSETRIVRQPLKFVSNESDRLKEKYSILVNQYSMSEAEYEYWEKLENVVENTGGLYDIIPASIPSNISCNENPDEKVLGFFSVSAVKSKRMFIKDRFRGIINLYTECEQAVIGPSEIPPNLGLTVWIIIDHQDPPPYRVITYQKGCADCTTRGTTVEPDFWNDDQ